MRKWLTVAVVSVVAWGSGVSIGRTAFAEEISETNRYEALSQEAERNRELLEIWKDHVKTLTKERDSAYKELEHFKATGVPMAAPMAQFGGVETQPIPSPAMAGKIEGLQSEVASLRAQLEQRSQNPSGDRELQIQFSALQTQLQQTRKELGDARTEKDRLMQEKEKALSQVERLNAQIENAPASSGPAASASDDAVSKNLQRALDIQKKRYDDLKTMYSELESEAETLRSAKEKLSAPDPAIRKLESQLEQLQAENERLSAGAVSGTGEDAERLARELRYENETLKAKIAKLEVVQKELDSTRAYFTPALEDLQKKNQQLSSQIDSIRAESNELREENQSLSQRSAQAIAQNRELSAQAQALASAQEESANQITSLKSQMQIWEADKEKYKGMEQEFGRITAENKSMQQGIADMRANMRSYEAKVRESSSQLALAQRSSEELRAHDQQMTKQAETYRDSLRANLTDIKNLKSNFESYLESLVASFEERQK